jgi:hypothetical protein
MVSVAPLVSVVITTYNRKQELLALLNSIFRSDYPHFEVIVVDDCPSDGNQEEMRKRFPSVLLVRNAKELLLAGSRNKGARVSHGEFLFFVDDDNEVDQGTISSLVRTLSNDERIGIVGPMMYYFTNPQKIWCAGVKRGHISGRIRFLGFNELDVGQFKTIVDSDDFPNAFMVRRKVFEKIGFFDSSTLWSHLSESDFCERARRVGYRVVMQPRAKIWHKFPIQSEFAILRGRNYMKREKKACEWERNRIIMKKRYSTSWNYLMFVILFEPIFITFFSASILTSGNNGSERVKAITSMLRGVADGLRYHL